jgi:CDP-paratose 2-epimerase
MNNRNTKDFIDSASANQSVIGIVEWFRVGEYQKVEAALLQLQELGITELRTGISWADYFTEAGKDWFDWLIPTIANQVTILPCFLYTPPSIGISPKTSAPPVNPKEFADFLDVIITKYDQYFEWVELWNEPNNISEYDYTLDKQWEKFCKMIGGAAFWMKKVGKKILLGGMSPVDPNWLQLMYDRR